MEVADRRAMETVSLMATVPLLAIPSIHDLGPSRSREDGFLAVEYL